MKKIKLFSMVIFLIILPVLSDEMFKSKSFDSNHNGNSFSGVTSAFADSTAPDPLSSIVYEVDALKSYGGGKLFTSATINAAIAAIGTARIATLVISPGNWVMDANITVPRNITLKLLIGTMINTTQHKLFINGPFQAGLYKVFEGNGIVAGLKEVHPEWWATNSMPGVTDMTSAIQHASDAAAYSKGTLVFDSIVYGVGSSIIIKSDTYLKGKGNQSILKVINAKSFNILTNNELDVSNVVIDGIGFDGSLNYPASSQIYQYGGTFPLNRAISITRAFNASRTTKDISNILVKNCYFNELSYNSIYISGVNIEDITIKDNFLFKGSYSTTAIWVRSSLGFLESQRAKRISVSGNNLDTNGPQIFYDPSKEDYVASADGIQLDGVVDSSILNNRVHKSGAIGIRIENSYRVIVIGNTVTESGSDGISFYKYSYACSCIGNTILNWGRTPPAYTIRNYNGVYIVAREFPDAALASLPTDPTASPWFKVWPYSLDKIDTSKIITYSNKDYYKGPSSGILPFRGHAAISTTSNSARISIIGNIAIGSSSTDRYGKLIYANDFGFSTVHSVNSPYPSGVNNQVIGNNFDRCNVYQIYSPYYMDSFNKRGIMGSASYIGNGDTNSLITIPKIP